MSKNFEDYYLMSTELKNKIYDFEEIPPAGVWENVALSLDELALQKNLFNKLYNEEATPPAITWIKIINTMDEELANAKLREDVLKLEMQPPTLTWEKISLELDQSPKVETFSKKMYDYEVTPSANNWEKITALLDINQTTAPVIPFHKSYNRIIRVAAAAAIIGIIAWAGFRLLNNTDKSTSNDLANKKAIPILPTLPVQQSVQESTAEVIRDNSKKADDKNLIAAINSTKVDFKKIIKATKENDVKLLNTLTPGEDHAASNDIAVADAKNLHKKNTTLLPSDDTISEARYLVYLTDQGDMVKLSKKMADLTCIYTKDGSISQGALAKLDASQCNDQVKYWQEKMANSSMQSSSNPLELIEILK